MDLEADDGADASQGTWNPETDDGVPADTADADTADTDTTISSQDAAAQARKEEFTRSHADFGPRVRSSGERDAEPTTPAFNKRPKPDEPKVIQSDRTTTRAGRKIRRPQALCSTSVQLR